ncbi:hypothetical protein GTCCBUS3UF5_37350 [Geobacillus thermoleovorans CCB_US3_UF5]|uniref:Uncharacterized protein n=1 Tax=Geobacillus thermoleovorans CCB_US3_UF5 TaxID=1111068 RepID=A0ABM5MMK0_GEOTH|nr:hypothetical protein GTCCBUS3UF5_37350 [Geobacillus thermoleovorans CCB_US3_UF5]
MFSSFFDVLLSWALFLFHSEIFVHTISIIDRFRKEDN